MQILIFDANTNFRKLDFQEFDCNLDGEKVNQIRLGAALVTLDALHPRGHAEKKVICNLFCKK